MAFDQSRLTSQFPPGFIPAPTSIGEMGAMSNKPEKVQTFAEQIRNTAEHANLRMGYLLNELQGIIDRLKGPANCDTAKSDDSIPPAEGVLIGIDIHLTQMHRRMDLASGLITEINKLV